ncbi:MAG: virulence RhuM family protein [Lachnospiraceae bacterium]|nr:virulence RhuM family protein [Lachnospiraceae bacterium]
MNKSELVEQLDSVLTSGNRKLLTDSGQISHDKAMKKAKEEYKKYQAITLSPVERAYMETIKDAGKSAKKGVRK